MIWWNYNLTHNSLKFQRKLLRCRPIFIKVAKSQKYFHNKPFQQQTYRTTDSFKKLILKQLLSISFINKTTNNRITYYALILLSTSTFGLVVASNTVGTFLYVLLLNIHPISCQCSFPTPPEKIRKPPIFLCFQGGHRRGTMTWTGPMST